MRPEPRRLSASLLLVLLLCGCILWPFGLPPGNEQTLIVDNRSDEDVVVRFPDPELMGYAYALPAETIGEIILFTSGSMVTVEIADPDCEPIAELTADVPLDYLVIEADLTLTEPDGPPPEPERLLSEFFACDPFGVDPALDDVDLDTLPAGRLIVDSVAGDLWSVSLPDGELRQLTSGPDADLGGDVAPDGSIAFARMDPAGFASALWLLEPDAKEPRLVRDPAHTGLWAPDGRRLAVIDADAFSGGLVVIDPSGDADEIRVTSDIVTSFTWDHTGERLAFLAADAVDPFAPDAESQLMVAVPGEQPTVLAPLPAFGALAWSPDGDRIAVETFSATGSAVSVVDARTGDELFVIDAGSPFSAAPSWSPDGERLVFMRSDGFDLSTTVMTVAATGGDPVELGDLGTVAVDARVIWSPDGAYIAVAGSGMTTAGEVWLVPVAGGDPVRLLTGANAVLGWR